MTNIATATNPQPRPAGIPSESPTDGIACGRDESVTTDILPKLRDCRRRATIGLSRGYQLPILPSRFRKIGR